MLGLRWRVSRTGKLRGDPGEDEIKAGQEFVTVVMFAEPARGTPGERVLVRVQLGPGGRRGTEELGPLHAGLDRAGIGGILPGLDLGRALSRRVTSCELPV